MSKEIELDLETQRFHSALDAGNYFLAERIALTIRDNGCPRTGIVLLDQLAWEKNKTNELSAEDAELAWEKHLLLHETTR